MTLLYNILYLIGLSFLIYYIIIIIIGIIRRDYYTPNNTTLKKFVIVIPAHNEEKILAKTISSIHKMRYSQMLIEVIVVSDCSTDNTVKIARTCGVTVLENNDENSKGKTNSIHKAIKYINSIGISYDALCILDADNIVSEEFLTHMSCELNKGNEIIQGYIDSKNYNDNWLTGNYYLFYLLTNMTYQLPRYNIGLQALITGTGFVVSKDVINNHPDIFTESLTDDLEFYVKATLKNLKISWCKEAVVYDENPLTIKASLLHRVRWMRGHIHVIRKYSKDLLKQCTFSSIDVLIRVIQPAFILILCIVSAWDFLSLFTHDKHIIQMYIMTMAQWTIMMFMLASILRFNDQTKRIPIISYVLIPVFYLSWIISIIWALLTPNDKRWFHTDHSRSIDIDDV